MKSVIIIGILIGFISSLNAQTGIGTTTPNASAKLDVYSTNKGFLPPRVTLTSATDATTIASPAEGLLVYNLGSVGLQAGYYYWNNANWATIATATSAGNGVTSMDMVKLYGEAWSSATNKIGNANGYSFTVPVSGRYLFDFSSVTYGSTNFSINFYVRQGTTNVGSDGQVSTNNGGRVEYNGKVEVNLQAGTTYNVYVTSTNPNRGSEDYDRVYYKLVAGNLPVTGQSVDYIQASLSSNQTLTAAGNIIFNVSTGAGIALTSGGFELKANKTYKLEAALGGSSSGYAYYTWVDNANNRLPGGSIGVVMQAGDAHTDAPQDKAVVFYTPTTNTTVYLRVLTVSGNIVAYAPPTASNYSSSWATIQQVGSSAFVNPWVLSGNNTFNTTGNVGIGNNAPAATLDVTGSLAVSGAATFKDIVEIGTGIGDEGGEFHFAIPVTNTTLQNRVKVDVSKDRLRFFEGSNNAKGVNIDLSKAPNGAAGELIWKVSGIINTGSFVQLDNLKAGPTRNGAGGGYAGLSIGAASSTFVANVSATYSNSTIGGTTATTVTYTTTASNSAFGWGFTEGHASTYILNDTTNSRVYRITLQIGASYNNNFISIERLY